MKQPDIILASASPRRRAFFRELGLRFTVVVPRVVEEPRKGEAPRAFAERAAVDKARWVAARQKGRSPCIIVAADTIVVLGRQILGKPKNRNDAARMLRALSGRWHEVITGVCVLGPRRRKSFVARTRVAFKELTRREIEAYIASGEPMDKAGAYAVQGIGSFMVRALEGSYTNVVGLPVTELLAVLEEDFGLEPRQ